MLYLVGLLVTMHHCCQLSALLLFFCSVFFYVDIFQWNFHISTCPCGVLIINKTVLCVAVLVAEMIKHYFPRMVDLHNYTPAHSSKQKMENWYLLNR